MTSDTGREKWRELPEVWIVIGSATESRRGTAIGAMGGASLL